MIQSADEFYRLRTSHDPRQYARAAREEAPLQVWLDVIDRYPEMRCWVVRNERVPVEVLEKLSADPDPEVRAAVARKRKLPEHLQQVLAQDEDRDVRYQVACNARATAAVLQLLTGDPAELVRRRALDRIKAAFRESVSSEGASSEGAE